MHGHDLAILPALRVTDGRHHEAHLQTRFPEGLGELVREEESVAVAALAEMVDSLIEAEPLRCSIGPIPSAKIESVGSCLQNDVAKYLLPCHSVSLGVGCGLE